MKRAKIWFGLTIIPAMLCAIVFAFNLGYSHGRRDESQHWLVSFNNGVLTARENPKHPLLPKAHPVRRAGAVNVVDSVKGSGTE